MGWKEFLKPNWRKIVLTIIFFLVGIFGKILLPFSISFLGEDSPIFSIIFLWPYGIIVFLLCPKSTSLEGLTVLRICPAPIIFFVLIILDIFYLYLLSCLIFRIYDKVKKKK